MTPSQARALAQTLIDAAALADAEGDEQVDLLPALREADDAARTELQAAIERVDNANI